ncbi:hypothetical protein B296_00017517 [Ensete ventricosum]|uniref:Uncharacterized protein n=1 Tax=Ensete ventricosum TaxID=4639 RepID=A0A426Y7I3_ENSVE|nr:hypothetical protein B296_00017517 [Ensete ventricosum]
MSKPPAQLYQSTTRGRPHTDDDDDDDDLLRRIELSLERSERNVICVSDVFVYNTNPSEKVARLDHAMHRLSPVKKR